MTNQTIDNSADEQFGNVILWQYDKAVNLCSFINELKTFFNSTTKNIWDEMLSEINVDDATNFGLSILGTLIGCPRPDGISTELYRKILKARFTLMMSNFSVYDINLYLKTIFGEGAIFAYDNGDLTYYPNRKYAIGDICEHEGSFYKCTTEIPSGEEWNSSHWSEIESYSSSSTYSVGDICLYYGGFYRCISTISTGEQWNENHWSQIKVIDGYAPMTLGWNVDDSDMSDEAKSLVENYPELVFNYPAGVFDGTLMTHHVFAFDGQEAVEPTDPPTGGLDDSNFMYDDDEETQYIPENERITS